MDRMTNAGTAPIVTYPSNSPSLYLRSKNGSVKKTRLQSFTWTHEGRSWVSVNTFMQSFKNLRESYLSWKKKTYVDPTQAMTQISQRMWYVQGPSSLSINLWMFLMQLWSRASNLQIFPRTCANIIDNSYLVTVRSRCPVVKHEHKVLLHQHWWGRICCNETKDSRLDTILSSQDETKF